MAITSLPGLPAPLSLIWAAIGAAWFWASVAKDRVAAVFSANEPALGTALKTYFCAAGPAAAVGPGVEPPVAALLLPVLVRWTTSSTITTTPTTEESR